MDKREEKMELVRTAADYTGRLIEGLMKQWIYFMKEWKERHDLVIQIIDGLKWTMEAITVTRCPGRSH